MEPSDLLRYTVVADMRDDEELERGILAYSARLRAVLETARQQIQQGEGVSHEDLWREVDGENTGSGQDDSSRARIALLP